jgi:hypothetical protein
MKTQLQLINIIIIIIIQTCSWVYPGSCPVGAGAYFHEVKMTSVLS